MLPITSQNMSLTKEILSHRFRWRLVILFLAVCSGLLGLSGPMFQKAFIDSLTIDGQSFSHSFQYLLYFFIFFMTSVATQLGAQYLGLKEANIIQAEISKRIYTKMLRLKSSQMTGAQVGEVVSLYTVDAAGSAALLELAWTNGALTLVPIILAPFMLQQMLNIPLAPLLITMGVSLAIMFFLSWRQSHFFWTFKKLAAERTGLANEWIQNIRGLRSLNWISSVENRIFKKRIAETENRITMVSNGQVMASLGSSVGFFLNLAGVFSLISMRENIPLSPGELSATFWALGVYLARPLRGIPWILTFTLDSYTSIKRVEKFLGIPEKSLKVLESVSLPNKGLLEIKSLNLEIAGQKLLHDVSLKIDTPEFVTIVGPVGSGKTLFVQSLIGECAAIVERYHLLGKNVALLNEEQLKSHFSLVPQDGFIASTSIQNNIELDYESSGSPEIKDCLQYARFDLSAEGFSETERTLLGERGVNLSGGQKQRLGLARALHAKRPILILDDSMSALDVNTEVEMIDSLFRGMLKNQLIFLVTHRHSTLALSDRTLFFMNGRLVGNAPYDVLLKTHSDFAKFIQQSREQEKDQGDELLK